MEESSEITFKFKSLPEDFFLSKVFNYDISMMKVHDKSHSISSTACQGPSTGSDGAKNFCSSVKLNSPPRCHNVSNLDELDFLKMNKKRKAFQCAKSSGNSTPLLFDVFNYETSMMRDNGGGKTENSNTPPEAAMLVDKENANIHQPLSKQNAAAHCQMKSSMKRKPLSPLNDHSRLNKTVKQPELNKSPSMETQIPPQAKRKNSQPHTVIQKCLRRPIYGGGAAEETPKSTLCHVFNFGGASSSNSEKKHTKKSFQYAPQILNFEDPAVHLEHLKNLEEAGCLKKNLRIYLLRLLPRRREPWCTRQLSYKHR